MTITERMPEPTGPDDERFVYVVTSAGLQAVREGAVAVDSERVSPAAERVVDHRPDEASAGPQDA